MGLLERLGHQVRVANNAASALSALQEGSPPDLVFSDIVMAGQMDGLALARLLRERHPELPVLLATGYSQAAENVSAEFRILRKPYSIDELKTAIDQVLLGATTRASGAVLPLRTARKERKA